MPTRDLHIPAVAFVGRSGSGKTTVVEQVIGRLSAAGWRVGSVKHHGCTGLEYDTPGKDSWRHVQAGSVHSVIAAPDFLADLRPLGKELEYEEILPRMDDCDIVIFEGYRHAGLPTVELFRDGNQREHKRPLRPLDDEQSVAVMTDMAQAREQAAQAGLPCFELDDIAGIVGFIEKNILEQI